MEMDDRVLADLVVERGLLTRERLDGYVKELAGPDNKAPSLAVLLLMNVVLNEAALYELAQHDSARRRCRDAGQHVDAGAGGAARLQRRRGVIWTQIR
jgi:hypothetical protein